MTLLGRIKAMSFPRLIALSMGVLLQIQVTLFASDTYLGLRINLADIFAPVLCIVVFGLLMARKTAWPFWRIRHLYIWLAGLFAVLIVSLMTGYLNYDEISRWALVNKIGGWAILSAIMILGGWVATNATEHEIISALRVFICFFVIVLATQIGILIAQSYPSLRAFTGYNEAVKFPIAGMMANRNAYALLFTAVLAYATYFYGAGNRIVPHGVTCLLYALIPFFLVFNGSRTGLLAVALVMFVCFAAGFRQYRQWIALLLSLAVGAGLFAAIFHDKRQELIFLNFRMYDVAVKIQESDTIRPSSLAGTTGNPGDNLRLVILSDAAEMIKQHPIMGGGLGSAMIVQARKYGQASSVVDNTPLWLLTETGLVGLAIFGAFFWLVVSGVFQNTKSGTDFQKQFSTATLIMMGGFSLMCLFHEVLYTRHLWFLTGMALCLGAPRTRQDE